MHQSPPPAFLYVSRPKLLLLKDGSDVLWLDFDSRPDCAVAEQTFVVWLMLEVTFLTVETCLYK